MIIAFAINNGHMSPHFGHCQDFLLITIEANQVVAKKLVANPGHRPIFLPPFLANLGIKVIIADGIGKKAIDLFSSYDIAVISGAKGNANDLLNLYLLGKLVTDENGCQEAKRSTHLKSP